MKKWVPVLLLVLIVLAGVLLVITLSTTDEEGNSFFTKYFGKEKAENQSDQNNKGGLNPADNGAGQDSGNGQESSDSSQTSGNNAAGGGGGAAAEGSSGFSIKVPKEYIILPKSYCTNESRLIEDCGEMQYPVCGWYNSTGLDCGVDSPCVQKFSSDCEACMNEQVVYWTEGDCPLHEKPIVT